jgi:hypothetical protein
MITSLSGRLRLDPGRYGRLVTVRVVPALIVLAMTIGLVVVASSPASADALGTGAVSVKGPSSELIPGATIEIRAGDCAGGAVWRTTTGNTPNAYGAFAISLAPGPYCVVTLAAPAPYSVADNVVFQMEQRAGNWVTVWLPGPAPAAPPVNGALVAKDAYSGGVDGVVALIQQGTCASNGPGVWQNTTATDQWSSGGFGISLTPGNYCAKALSVPANYALPAPVDVVVSAPGPAWITLWLGAHTYQGATDSIVPVDFHSDQKILQFSCPACTGNTVVWAYGTDGSKELLVNEIGAFPNGRFLVGLLDFQDVNYDQIAITANSAWTMQILSLSAIRTVWSSASGTSPDVVRFAASGSAANVSYNGNSNFVVWATNSTDGLTLVANEIGAFWGTEHLISPSVVQVDAIGAWQIDVG